MQKKLWWTALMTPLVITPVAIVASCSSGTSSNNDVNGGSNDKPTNDSNNGSTGSLTLRSSLINLDSLTEEQKEITQYVNDKTKLIKLILEKKDQIFVTDGYYDSIDEKQIEIDGYVKSDIKFGFLSFTIKVKASADPNASILIDQKIELRGFGWISLKDIQGQFTLKSLTDEQKDATQYVNDRTKLIKLILENKDQIFETNYYNLTENQINIDSSKVNINFQDGSLSFHINVTTNADPNSSILVYETITLKGFGKFYLKGATILLSSLTEQEKEINQYVGFGNIPKLIKLVIKNKDEIFETDYYTDYLNNLNENQIYISFDSVTVGSGFSSGSLKFWIKVKAGFDSTDDFVFFEGLITLYGFK